MAGIRRMIEFVVTAGIPEWRDLWFKTVFARQAGLGVIRRPRDCGVDLRFIAPSCGPLAVFGPPGYAMA